MQDINDELIDKFFKGLCTKEEAVKVLAFLKKHPDHHYLAEEWSNTDSTTPLPAKVALEMYDAVTEYTGKEEKGKVKILWRIAAAACIITVFAGIWYKSVKNEGHALFTETKVAQVESWIEKQNTQDTAIRLVLADGSRITLSPGTYLRYRKDFGQAATRDIYMTGDAFFEVAKNKAKPFTVYSDFISTTALGTAFRVTDSKNGKKLKVRLNEGKVVVMVTDTVYKKLHKNYYLVPGEEIVFEAKDKMGVISGFNKKNNAVTTAGKKIDTLNSDADKSYMFNNQTLADVLDQLSVIYHITITYSKPDIGKMYFIGTIDRNDPVEKTIRDIALLNKLSVKKQNGGFILRRNKH